MRGRIPERFDAPSPVVGNVKEVALRCIAQKERIDWIYVPYPADDSPGLTDLLGGHIEVLSAGPVMGTSHPNRATSHIDRLHA